MLLIGDSALQKDTPYCRKVAMGKKGRLEGGGGRDPARGGKKIYHRLISHLLLQRPFTVDSVTSTNFLAHLLFNMRLNRYSKPSVNNTISLNYMPVLVRPNTT